MAGNKVSVIGLLLSGSLGLCSLGIMPYAIEDGLLWIAFLLLLGAALGAAGVYYSVWRTPPASGLAHSERLQPGGRALEDEPHGE